MKRGPKPIDKKILNLRGSWRAGTKTLKENPTGTPGGSVAPSVPSYIKGEARSEWHYVVPKLRDMGVIDLVDRATIAAYCLAFQRWRKAERLAAKSLRTGKTNKDGKKYYITNPDVWLAVALRKEMTKLAKELYLTPASRSNLKIEKNEVDLPETKPAMFNDTA